MRKLIGSLALLFLCALASGQSTVFQGSPTTRTQNKGYIGADSGLVLTPVASLGTGAFPGEIRQQSDFTLWIWNGAAWNAATGSGGGGSADGNNYPTTLSYNTGTKVLTLGRSGLASLTVSIPYGDTSGLSAKVKYSDTANMLLHYLRQADAAGTYVPLTRTITINGTTYDLSANRSWTISTGAGSPDSSIFATRYYTGQTYALASHNQAWSTITTTPTTLAGYGITDGITSAGVAAAYATLSHTHTFASLTSKPTTLAGYGITDAITAAGAASLYATISHTHAQSDVTGLVSALAGKEPTITAGATSQYWRGDKSWQTLDKSAVSLGNVDNTSDANKPVSTAQQTALDAKADKIATVSAKTTSYTLTSADAGKVITFNSASGVTCTVPSGLGSGFNCLVVQLGAGQVTLSASSTTIQNRQSFTKTAGQYAILTLVSYTSNTFISSGDMQ